MHRTQLLDSCRRIMQLCDEELRHLNAGAWALKGS